MIEERILEIAPRLSNLTSRQTNGRFTAPTRKLLRKLRKEKREPHAIINEHLANLAPREREKILSELEEEHAARMETRRLALEEINRSRIMQDLREFTARLRNLTGEAKED